MKCISVIIPCYNSEQYIRKCLDSVVNQTIGIENIEVICINDASTDNTFNILCAYESLYPDSFLIINNKVNTKQGYARNLAVKYSSAEYITFVDSDDYIGSNMLEKMYKHIINGNYDYVSCRYYRVINNKNVILDDNDGKTIEYTINDDDMRKKLIIDECDNPGCCCTLYSKSFILSNNIFFAEGIVYEDLPWIGLTHLYAKKILVLPDRFYYYVDHNNSSIITKRNSNHHFDRLSSMKIYLSECKNRGLYDLYKDEIQWHFLEIFYINTLTLFSLRFDSAPATVLSGLRSTIITEMPDYKNNPYVKNAAGLTSTILSLLDKNIQTEDTWNEILSIIRDAITLN